MSTQLLEPNVKSCQIIARKLNPDKTEHKVKKFMRRVKESVKPTHARVRYDSMYSKWAVLNKDNTPHHHFEYGILTNVVFSTAEMKGYDPLRCAQINEFIGVAEGDLVENTYGDDPSGYRHMGLDKTTGKFVDSVSGAPITHAKILRVMTNRHALYK